MSQDRIVSDGDAVEGSVKVPPPPKSGRSSSLELAFWGGVLDERVVRSGVSPAPEEPVAE